MRGKDWPNVAEVAEVLDKTERTVRRLCESGKLIHRKEGKAYLIDPASLEEYILETSSAEDIMSDRGQAADVHRTSSEEDEDIAQASSATHRTSSADLDRTSDKDADVNSENADIHRTSDILPSELAVLSHKLRISEEAIRASHDDMSDIAGLIFERLCFEYRRNERIQKILIKLLKELQADSKLGNR